MIFIKKLLIGNTVSDKCECSLKKMGYSVVKFPAFDRLQSGVASHADMLVFYDGIRLFTHEEYYTQNIELFMSLGVQITTTDEKISSEYPNDILFNAVLTNDGILFSKNSNTSKYIKNISKRTVNVKQGYTACSTCRVSNGAFITTDEGLGHVYAENGIDVLVVKKQGIELPGYDCGFIGGASAVLEKNVCFFGNIEKHSDFSVIKNFVEKYNKTVVPLSDEKLTDIGGAVLIE